MRSLIVAPVTADDLPAIRTIEKQSPSPWSMSQLEGELFGSHGLQLACRCQDTNRLVGFMMGRVIFDEAEILKIAINLEDRRRGAAGLLINKFLRRIRAEDVRKCYLELRSANTSARCLYEKFDFLMTGLRNNYYSEPKDDAVCMSLTLV